MNGMNEPQYVHFSSAPCSARWTLSDQEVDSPLANGALKQILPQGAEALSTPLYNPLTRRYLANTTSIPSVGLLESSIRSALSGEHSRSTENRVIWEGMLLSRGLPRSCSQL